MSKKPLAIYGAGGLGRELSMWVRSLPGYEFIGFFDDKVAARAPVANSVVIGGLESVSKYNGVSIVIGIGDPQSRTKLSRQLEAMGGVLFPTVIHPRAIIEDTATVVIGGGSIVTAGCVLTTNIVVGKHVLINLNT